MNLARLGDHDCSGARSSYDFELGKSPKLECWGHDRSTAAAAGSRGKT